MAEPRPVKLLSLGVSAGYFCSAGLLQLKAYRWWRGTGLVLSSNLAELDASHISLGRTPTMRGFQHD